MSDVTHSIRNKYDSKISVDILDKNTLATIEVSEPFEEPRDISLNLIEIKVLISMLQNIALIMTEREGKE